MKHVLQSSSMGWAAGLALALGMVSVVSAQNVEHGRKWKPLPPTAHVVVTVVKGFNDKPLPNAAVIFHAMRNGRDDGNLEVKTDPDGKAIIDVIPTGSTVRVQVIAPGFATFAEEYEVTEATKEIAVAMIHPREQVSSYENNDGKAATRKPGVQEPIRPTTPATKPAPITPPATSQQPATPNSTPQQ